MSLRQYCCLSASALLLAACQTNTAPNHAVDAAFLVGLDSGEALRYFGPPSHGSPPSVTGGVLSWQAAHVFVLPTGQLLPVYPSAREARTQNEAATPTLPNNGKSLTQLRCQVRVHSDAQFITTQVSIQHCQAF